MGEGHLEKLQKTVRTYITLWLVVSGILLIGLWWLLDSALGLENILTLGILGAVWLILSTIAGVVITKRVTQPLQYLGQAIMHISPSEHIAPSPNMDELKIGQELVAVLTRQVYEFASTAQTAHAEQKENTSQDITQQIPIPVIGINSQQVIVLANQAAQTYCGQEGSIIGKNIYSVMDLSFSEETTLDAWLKNSQTNSVTATGSWERVQFSAPSGVRYIDLAAQFSKQNSNGIEVLLTLFDHTKRYSQEDGSMNFVALAVHELRTPLTILRGYIELFDEELGSTLNPELADSMRKMEASAENLTAFVSNILNVARVDQNQLTLNLAETNWPELLTKTVDNMRLRAQVRKLTIDLVIAKDLPTVAADSITATEVVNNLIENAIKYSSETSEKIIVEAKLCKDGTVETTIQDFGVGIPASVMPFLFQRFSRNHRTRSSVSGTGLGLYLSKAIVSAHGGNIWANSNEGKGSVFGFSLIPYSKLAEQAKTGDNTSITRSAHGWIKNHSLYRQ